MRDEVMRDELRGRVVAGIFIVILWGILILRNFEVAENPTPSPEAEVPRTGIASWYGSGDPKEGLNKFTANGEVFDPTQMTVASWDYAFGTRLLVTNVETGESVMVRVNDRGPARRLKRIIDLSREAFGKIAPLEQGLVEVEIRKVEEE